jgi:glycosyltransferase involved in cell wall biosynthesis
MTQSTSKRPRLGILTTHPIQYQAPLFRALAERTDLTVYFAHRQTPEGQAGAGFGVAFEWDVPLLDGYEHHFLQNVAGDPSPLTFRGCDTPEIDAIIRRRSFDAFLVGGWFNKSYLQAIYACKRAGTPLLVRGDSQLQTPRSPLKRIVKNILFRAFLRVFDRCLYVGERSRAYYRHYGVGPEKLVFSPHFVDNAFFASRAERVDRLAERERMQIEPDESAILFVGKFIPEKAPLGILQAARILKDRGRRPVCVFVGGGPLEAEIRRVSEEAGVRTIFAGFKNQSELPPLYRAADVLVLPSISETWGLVVNEGFACGLPAVVSNGAGCAPDLITDGETGASFDAGDTDGFADALEQVLDIDRERTRSATRERIARYSVDAAADGVVKAAKALFPHSK